MAQISVIQATLEPQQYCTLSLEVNRRQTIPNGFRDWCEEQNICFNNGLEHCRELH